MQARSRASSVALAMLILAGCSATGPSTPAVSTRTLTIFGAASLGGVLDETRSAYQAAAPGVQLTISTDSSATLEAQIELGGPADVFLSADTANPEKLVDKGLAGGQPVVFATNNPTVIVPAGNPADVATAFDLARAGLRVIGAGDSVPITKYAGQVIARLAALPGAPADFAARYAANVRSKEDNVRAVVAKIELGEGDAAIVYLTDAAASSKVATIALPAAANVPASYAGVVVKASHDPALARAFLDWFAGPAGQAILARRGFLPPG